MERNMSQDPDFDRGLDRRNTCSLKWDFCERALKEKDVIPMWVADMDFAAPEAVIEAVKARAGHGAYGYTMVPRSYWASIVAWLATRYGWQVKREWLTKSPGVVPALNLCVRAFSRPGDKVVIQTPVYHPFHSAPANNGRQVVRNPLRFRDGRWTMDLEDLARKVDGRTRLLILCSPHNPVGRVWTREELEALGRVAREKDFLIVSDEIHAELVLGKNRHVPLASLDEDLAARTITCVAPSKAFNIAGLNMSVVVASNRSLLERFDIEAQNTGLTMGNVFGVAALEAAYTHGGGWLDRLLVYLEGNMDFAAEFVRTRLPRLAFLKPEGTYLALLDCRKLELPQRQLNEFFLKKARVYFDEGPIFGEELEGFVRMNLACPRATVREALERIEKALEM
jgi:cystathionine beta-lyase